MKLLYLITNLVIPIKKQLQTILNLEYTYQIVYNTNNIDNNYIIVNIN